ncbi:MAG: hypothetical protein WD749_05445 [Phycisphaerales bacterium]
MPRTLQDEIGKRRPFERPREEAYLSLLRTCSVLSCPFARLFRAHGLSEATYNILRILRGEAEAGRRGLPTRVIGDRLIARVPDITRLVDRLEAAALVARQRTAEDRRLVLVSITRPGLALLARLDQPVKALHERQLGHMTEPELRQLSRLLSKSRRNPGADPQ